jgi:CubicO group peptidase (beta-lactamase class C family)
VDTSGIDGSLDQAVAERVVPGVVAVAGDRDGTSYEAAFGSVSADGGAAARPDTMIALASMTKAITCVAALQLLEQERIELQQPVGDILPSFDQLQVLEGFDGDVPRLRAPASRATIRQLFTHTSGLAYFFANADILRYHQLTGIPDPTLGMRRVFEIPLVADPGTRWEYGISTDWLGLVIEAVSGQDLASYCEQHIFTPLGMSETTFRPSPSQRARLMTVHARTPDAGLVPAPVELPSEPEFWSGGAGAVGTGPDYLRFMRALLRGGELDGERILSPHTVELAFTDHLDGLELPAVMRSAVPELTNDVPALPFAQGFGLGLHLTLEDLPGVRRSGSGDWAGLFNCYFWVDRSAGVAGALLTQVLPFFDARVVELALAFEAAIYAQVGATATA